MITSEIDLTKFNAGLVALGNATRLQMPALLKKETGELIKMLIRLSPPKNIVKSRASIGRKIDIRFAIMKPSAEVETGGEIKWTGSNEKFLFGINPNVDMRGSSAQQVLDKYLQYSKTRGGRQSWTTNFKSPRKAQRVRIEQRLVITKSLAAATLKLIGEKFGKLKAAWMEAVKAGIVNLTGGSIPSYVTRHMGTRNGRVINQLGEKHTPAVTIINSSPGIGATKQTVSFAVNARAVAMVKNAQLFTAGIKHLSDYNAGKATILR